MKKKQTAVEWLVEQLNGENHLTITEINRLVEQAIKMERRQIIEAHNNGYWEGDDADGDDEQYYESKYGKHENKAENND